MSLSFPYLTWEYPCQVFPDLKKKDYMFSPKGDIVFRSSNHLNWLPSPSRSRSQFYSEAPLDNTFCNPGYFMERVHFSCSIVGSHFFSHDPCLLTVGDGLENQKLFNLAQIFPNLDLQVLPTLLQMLTCTSILCFIQLSLWYPVSFVCNRVTTIIWNKIKLWSYKSKHPPISLLIVSYLPIYWTQSSSYKP